MHLSWVKTGCRHHVVQGQKAADAQNQGNFEYVVGNCSATTLSTAGRNWQQFHNEPDVFHTDHRRRR